MTTTENEPHTADQQPADVTPRPSLPSGGPGGDSRPRVDGASKATGTAPYAYEQPVDDPAYLFPVVSTIARGRIRRIDRTKAEAVPGVLLVMTHENAPSLRIKTNPDLWILQNRKIAYHGQFIGAVVAETAAIARYAASLVEVDYDEDDGDVEFRLDHPEMYSPRRVNALVAGTEDRGDVDAAIDAAPHSVDATYASSAQYHNPIEPHPIIAVWHRVRRLNPRAIRLTLYDANQGAVGHIGMLPPLFGLLPNQVEIISPFVGGSFGTKGMPHGHIVLAVLAAKRLRGRPVKLALTRQQMFRSTGYRQEIRQRVRLAADGDGNLTAIDHQSWAPTSKLRVFVEQTVSATRMMYSSPNRRTIHHAVKQDINPPLFMRAPGEFPGMFALETAIDELAVEMRVDPIDLRVRNEPEVDPETGKPFSTRNLVACLREGAQHFGWDRRSGPRAHRDGEWLIGMGVASATYPHHHWVPSRARIAYRDGRYRVEMQASDVGTGAWTILPQIAADALGVPVELVEADIGHSKRPWAMLAGGSVGTYEWGTAVVAAAEKFRRRHGDSPKEGASVTATGFAPRRARRTSRHSFGAHFCELRVSDVTGEIRVDRMFGLYGPGRIMNPRTARSQLIGGMTMGISAALFEEAYRDPRFGHVVNGDLAGYHIAAHADITEIEAAWIEEFDPQFGSTGAKGIGELGIVGVPAAVSNAIHDAVGIRLRELPFTPDKVLDALES